MVARNYSSTAAETQLAEACTGSATVLRVASIVGLPTVPFFLIVDADTVYEEIVLVSAIAGTNLTVARGQDGTTGLPHEVGARVRHGFVAQDAREAANHIASDSDVHGVGSSSSVVGTNTAQVLKNKTIDQTNTINTDALPTEVRVARLRLTSTTDASTGSTAHAFQVGDTAGSNIRIDDNEILSLNGGAPSGLNLRENASVSVPEPSTATEAATKKYVDDRTDDTGWQVTALTGNYTGTYAWRVRHGKGEFSLIGERVSGAGNISDADALFTTLASIAPSRTKFGPAFVGSNTQRAYIQTNGEVHVNPLTINAGNTLRVDLEWTVG